jgi:PD-(D/E)XK nuclease superfamily
MATVQRQTLVVGSQTAWHHYQFEFAQRRAAGVQVVTVQGLAERLAGGFLRGINRDELLNAATEPLQSEKQKLGHLRELADLPGMARALCDTLVTAWESGLDLSRHVADVRCADLHKLEKDILSCLPADALPPSRLVAEAMARLDLAVPLLGSVTFKGVYAVGRCWRRLFAALAERIPVTWEAFGELDKWLGETHIQVTQLTAKTPASAAVSCATPSHEMIEALRWARELIVSGRAKPHEIAITSASVDAFDDYLRALRAECDLPLFFAEGDVALSSYPGQQAAALAELLLCGISQDRVLRAVRFLRHENTELKALPEGWDRMLNPSAPLLHVEHWEHEFERIRKEKDVDLRPSLLTFVKDVDRSLQRAKEVGDRWLRGIARQIWQRALAEGPPSALATTLERVRVPDETEPVACVLWGPAAVTCTVPRRFVRFVGLSSRWWPRIIHDDPLLPEHILGHRLAEYTIPQQDRLHFEILTAQATEVVFSRSRRDKEGRLLGTSPLFPADITVEHLSQSCVPAHAFSRGDRLVAREHEFAQSAVARSVALCIQDHRRTDITAHDGLVRAQHPVILAALDQIQSTTSLKLLLRNPLGFVWKYALHWKEPEDLEGEEPLFFDVLQLGIFVHEILKLAVGQMESEGGLFQASHKRISEVVRGACQITARQWETEQPVPPALIWGAIQEEARDLALRALTQGHLQAEGLRSFVEVPFGDTQANKVAELPWDATKPVVLPCTEFRVGGRIDRLDLTEDHSLARVTDYKVTRETPTVDPGLNKGNELQRAVYGFVVKALLPEVKDVEAALLYAREGTRFVLQNLPEVMESMIRHLNFAAQVLKHGYALPGVGMEDDYEGMRFALPANVDAFYLPRKLEARNEHLKDLLTLWNE